MCGVQGKRDQPADRFRAGWRVGLRGDPGVQARKFDRLDPNANHGSRFLRTPCFRVNAN